METLNKIKDVLNVTEITEEQIRKDGGDYNQKEWDKIIDRYKAHGSKFYLAPPQRGYEYPRYYGVYKADGIKFFKSINYHSSLSSNGMCIISIRNGIVTRELVEDVNGNIGRIENNQANRKLMNKNSRLYNTIYSNEF